MNIKQRAKDTPVHKMREGFRYSICGLLWLSSGRTKETTEEVTCKHCLKMMK